MDKTSKYTFRNKSIIFLLYYGRSGSTLLASLLDQYTGITVMPETAFVSRILKYPDKSFKKSSIENIISYLFKEIQFQELGLDKSILQNILNKINKSLTKKKIIQALTEHYFITQNEETNVWIIKHPPVNYLSEVQNLFDNVRFIHIIRDGRATYNSIRQTKSIVGPIMQPNLIKSSYDWKKYNSKFEKIPHDKVIHLKYENLVANKEKTVNDILNWLNLIESEKTTKMSKGAYVKKIGEKQKSLHKNVGKKIDKSIAEKWKNQLNNVHIMSYELLNSKFLMQSDYSLVYSNRNITFFIKSIAYLVYSSIQFIFLKVFGLINRIVNK